jgi:hypothetical protein
LVGAGGHALAGCLRMADVFRGVWPIGISVTRIQP